MRKIVGMLALSVFISASISAQQCTNFDSIVANPGTGTVPGFEPHADSLPCLIAGSLVTDTLYFTDFSQISGFPVDSVTIDSINNLPPGLCWVSNKTSNTFGAGENGVILINGYCSAAPGQYKLEVLIEATGVINIPPNTNIESETGVRYYLRVECPGAICQPIDSAGGVDSLYIPYLDQQPCTAGVTGPDNHISAFTVSPDPFYSSALISFYSDITGPCVLRLTDMVGNIVLNKDLAVSPGYNNLQIARDKLTSGLYLLSLSGPAGSAARKVVIE